MTRQRTRLGALACAVAITTTLAGAGSAQAAITPVTLNDAGADVFATSVFRNPSIVGSPSFEIHPFGASTGVSTAFGSAFPTNGSDFGILSTGLATSADDPNANVPDSPNELDDKTTNFNRSARGSHDVTIVEIPFSAPQGSNCLTMDFQFLSEEYPEFVGRFNDAFIAELDTSNWVTNSTSQTISAPNNFAFDADGDVVSVNAVGLGGFSTANAAGTTYDGATPLLRASKQLTPGAHTLYLSIFDQGDHILDSAAFVDNVRVGFIANPAQNCVAGAQVANYTLDLAPGTATHATGTQHTGTVSLEDEDGNPIANAGVVVTWTGANAGSTTVTTDAAGNATVTYTGTHAGTDSLSATYDADGDGTAEATDSATVVWENRYALDAEPETATRTTGQQHTVTATLTNDGAPAAGESVTFNVTGANPRSGTATTDAGGVATFSYTGTALGTDEIVASYDLSNGDAGAEASDTVTVEWVNTPPDCTGAGASIAELKQNNHKFNAIRITGVTDADGDAVTTTITSVQQDEVVNGAADGNTTPDARRTSRSDTVEVRAERAGNGDGRVYVIAFTGDDGRGGTCSGTARVSVPHDQRGASAVDSGVRYDSFGS